ncbi:hypothetical protein KUK83_002515 [Vibrio parahaemolyticus]|nr:hypothetical protein [Vibrio parahaemolyticus]EHR6924697.1 hypothetical protein [Vibrio parahaemolyticus]EIV1892217.1 hypothetical protein [Vibrio parahaemolyticus]EIZ1176202.1 hypothetical protein [Vibrio parahaemolyticus]EKG2488214.1 hypothetical protein [Vibrio parahaemolyticus]
MNSHSTDFFDLVKDLPVTKNGKSLTIALNQDTDVDAIKRSVDDFGIRSQTFSLSADQKSFDLKPDSVYWHGGNKKYFDSFDSLLKDFRSSANIPLGHLVLDSNIKRLIVLSEDSVHYKRLHILEEYISLLAKLCDQAFPDSGVMCGYSKMLFFVKYHDTVNRIQTSLEFSWEDLTQALPHDKLTDIYQAIIRLKAFTNDSDVQAAERKSCLRSALDSLISSSPDTENVVISLIKRILLLEKTYIDHHNMFLSEFNVNKLIQEIDEKELDYISEINDLTSSAQTKALAIPGAFVAVATIMKINESLSAFFVLVGLVFTSIIIDRCLSIYKSSFRYLDRHIISTFEIYKKLDKENKVRKKAHKTKVQLIKVNKNAKMGLEFIRGVIWATVIACAIFLTVKVNTQPSTPPQTSSVSQSLNP